MWMNAKHIANLLLSCATAAAVSGCLIEPLSNGAIFNDSSGVGSMTASAKIDTCVITAPGSALGSAVLECTVFGITSTIEGQESVLELVLAIFDPMILQVPVTSGNFSGSLITSSGTFPLVITAGLTSIPIDANTTLFPEPGMQLVIVDVPPGTVPGSVIFSVHYSNPGPTIKAIFAAKVPAGGTTFYPPMMPCATDFAAVPSLSTSITLSNMQIASMLTGLTPCNHKAYVFPGGATAPVDVVEFYNASLDHYFITWLPKEISDLDMGVHVGWVRTGKTFKTYTTALTGTSQVCRFYIPPAQGDSHFFGRGKMECDDTASKFPSFVLEDPAFMQMFLPVAGVCPANTTEVYRVFSNRADANHRYMTDKAVRDAMVAKGWLAEGDGPNLVVMCAPQ